MDSTSFPDKLVTRTIRWLFVAIVLAACFSGCRRASKTENETDAPPVKVDGDAEYREAQRQFDQQNYDQTIEHLQAALKADLKLYSKSMVQLLLGQAYRLQGKYDEAINAFTKAIESDPKNHEAFTFRGVVYRLQKKYALALDSYQKALEIKPESATLQASIGALFIFQNRFEMAVEHLQLAVELDPSLPVAHSNLAIAQANLGKFDLAQASLEVAGLLGYRKVDVVQAKIDLLKLAAIKAKNDND